jgi:hypothetical protein
VKINTAIVVYKEGMDLVSFTTDNEDVAKGLLFDDTVIKFALAESRKRVKFAYISPDERVERFYASRHSYPEDIIEQVGVAIIYMLPVKCKNLNASKVANFVVDCMVNLFNSVKGP